MKMEMHPAQENRKSWKTGTRLSGFGVSIDPENPYPEIANIPRKQLLASALKPISEWLFHIDAPLPMSEEEAIEAGILVPNENFAEALYQRQVIERNEAAAKVRDKFFRFLLKEYRRVFGDDHPRVAEALNLLASCLIDVGDAEEAEARLRESIALANEHDKAVALELLRHVIECRR